MRATAEGAIDLENTLNLVLRDAHNSSSNAFFIVRPRLICQRIIERLPSFFTHSVIQYRFIHLIGSLVSKVSSGLQSTVLESSSMCALFDSNRS